MRQTSEICDNPPRGRYRRQAPETVYYLELERLHPIFNMAENLGIASASGAPQVRKQKGFDNVRF
ncbi:MAG TPA: hypothetical protein VHG27_04800 [Xanthobacteraceae bacterium]|nr:hypothetical protein [Xanthobacteraceae bacterium]